MNDARSHDELFRLSTDVYRMMRKEWLKNQNRDLSEVLQEILTGTIPSPKPKGEK